ncbi:tumor necrosis factor receptor superfamily member 3-like isoform X2 [Petromyzon marinus]|uniref:tumor necrosis factor receptor superfamily member 3-like isoform X2 n=1 Tax=Petromyzon marinus TaxID=7757 RepID=UPI003F6F38B3
MMAATYALLAAAMLCVGGAPVTLPPCTLPGPWDIRCLPGCFLQVESGTCAPCPHGSFMEHTNTDHTCRRCRSCDGGAGFEEGRPCSAPADAECRCRPGLHCVSPDCPLCSGQPLCPPGRQPGPPPEATSCVPCPPGSYSDSTSALPCREHTRCEDREMSTFINGTQEADAICKHQNNPMVLIGSCFFGVLVIVLTFLALFLYKSEQHHHHTVQLATSSHPSSSSSHSQHHPPPRHTHHHHHYTHNSTTSSHRSSQSLIPYSLVLSVKSQRKKIN